MLWTQCASYREGEGGLNFNWCVTLSILLLFRQELLQEISCFSKNFSSSQEVWFKGQNLWVLFLFNITKVMWALWWRGTCTVHTLPALTVLKLREKMRWLHQYSLEIEQHHNYQGPVVSLYECINPTTIRSHWRVHFLQDTGQVELWTLISYRVNSDFWWK